MYSGSPNNALLPYEGPTSANCSKVIGKTRWFKKQKRRNGKPEEGRSYSAPLPKEMRMSRRETRGPENHVTEAVLFVPCTYGGVLQKMIQEGEDKYIEGTLKKRVRVVERQDFLF